MQLRAEHLDYIYAPGTVYEQHALKDINFEIEKGEYVGIIGRTGSGKSTLVQHLNGLIRGTSGHIYFNDEDIYAKGYDMKQLRQKIGLVFQYPEYQLFESDVLTDVKFGPKNKGLSDEEATEAAKRALSRVGISPEVYDNSPFDLSGGQKRRVAIAGVLAMEPEILILDEPTAGLDPKGRDDILGYIDKLHDETGITVILVSHSMEDIARFANKLFVIDDGDLIYNDTPREVFKNYKELDERGLSAPQVTYLMAALRDAGYPVRDDIILPEEAVGEIKKIL